MSALHRCADTAAGSQGGLRPAKKAESLRAGICGILISINFGIGSPLFLPVVFTSMPSHKAAAEVIGGRGDWWDAPKDFEPQSSFARQNLCQGGKRTFLSE